MAYQSSEYVNTERRPYLSATDEKSAAPMKRREGAAAKLPDQPGKQALASIELPG